tara:strand:- start:2163 stop:2735 length:573 start_codon:yes stop_codon:yes gene_type:complete
MVALAPLALTAFVLTAPLAQAAEQVSPVAASHSAFIYRSAWDCGNKAVMVGVMANEGHNIHRLGAICREIRANGNLGKRINRPVKGDTRYAIKNFVCPKGNVIAGVDMYSGLHLKGISIYCKKWYAAKRFVTGDYTTNILVGSLTNDIVAFRCSGPQYMVKAFRTGAKEKIVSRITAFANFRTVCDVHNK